MVDAALVGRDRESAVLRALLADAPAGGACLVLRGEVGVGKSALLRAAAQEAAARGMTVLRSVGVQAETRLPFGGLHQLLRPLLRGAAGGRDGAWQTVLNAMGPGLGDVHPSFRVAHAVLELLTDAAQDHALLLVVDDAQWLDGPSWDVLAFVGRRLSSDAVVALIGVRTEQEPGSRLSRSGLDVLDVEPLTEESAAALLDSGGHELGQSLRRRILAEAAGNPLGLLELPAAAGRFGEQALLPAWLPLTTRLENTFAASAAELPHQTRVLLLAAALDETGAIDQIVDAAAAVAGTPVTADDLAPAVAARLVELGADLTVGFRHPLVRSAVRQSAQPGQRRQVHAALAAVLRDDEDRSVWHRAAAAGGPDDELARDLVAVAARGRNRGDRNSAVRALERAAELSTAPAERAGRLLRAAGLGMDLGEYERATSLLQRVDESALVPADRARLAWLRELHLGAGWSGAARLTVFVAIADQLRLHGDVDYALESLETISLRAWWSNPNRETRAAVAAAVDRLPVAASAPQRLALLAAVEPVERGGELLDRLRAVVDTVADSEQLLVLAQAASSLGAFAMSGRLFGTAVAGLRDQGGGGLLARARISQAWNAVHTGDARLALTAAAEGQELADETRQPLWGVTAGLARGAAEALRGNGDSARSAADEGERVLLRSGVHPMLALVQLIRGIDALGGGRPEDAYQELRRVFEPMDAAYHPYARFWLVGYLAEAGVRTDHRDDVLAMMRSLEAISAAAGSPVLQLGLAHARALTAERGDADQLFRAALATDLSGWPFERARLLLAHGTWLRRQRRPAESRPLLRGAEAAFDALGTTPWADKARHELRASGETIRHADDLTDRLTPQELHIAELAAGGLSNRQIAEALFLSPRTVSTHLYRIYPKLGVASRTDLADALAGAPTGMK